MWIGAALENATLKRMVPNCSIAGRQQSELDGGSGSRKNVRGLEEKEQTHWPCSFPLDFHD